MKNYSKHENKSFSTIALSNELPNVLWLPMTVLSNRVAAKIYDGHLNWKVHLLILNESMKYIEYKKWNIYK